MRTPVIIPARGGSKGIPRKNLRPLAGKPLIAWTIEQVLATPGLDCYVSTEDAEIAEVSRHWGARVIERPRDLAQDTTASEPVIEHAIDVITSSVGLPDQVMFLQATSPIRRADTLARAVQQFTDTGVDSLVGVVPEPIFIWAQDPDVRALYPYQNRPRRQDMTPEQLRYRETGSLYLTRTEVYLEQHNRLGGRIGLFIMDPVEGVDIDAPEDFILAAHTLATLTALDEDKQ
ncbi:acylneuraminate cytidylyltransferase family protein [Tessaracoccus sp. G1721]